MGIVVPLVSTKSPLWKLGMTVSSRDFALFWGDGFTEISFLTPYIFHFGAA